MIYIQIGKRATRPGRRRTRRRRTRSTTIKTTIRRTIRRRRTTATTTTAAVIRQIIIKSTNKAKKELEQPQQQFYQVIWPKPIPIYTQPAYNAEKLVFLLNQMSIISIDKHAKQFGNWIKYQSGWLNIQQDDEIDDIIYLKVIDHSDSLATDVQSNNKEEFQSLIAQTISQAQEREIIKLCLFKFGNSLFQNRQDYPSGTIYYQSLLACDLVDWLVHHQYALDVNQAIYIGQWLMYDGMRCAEYKNKVKKQAKYTTFYDDYIFYTFLSYQEEQWYIQHNKETHFIKKRYTVRNCHNHACDNNQMEHHVLYKHNDTYMSVQQLWQYMLHLNEYKKTLLINKMTSYLKYKFNGYIQQLPLKLLQNVSDFQLC